MVYGLPNCPATWTVSGVELFLREACDRGAEVRGRCGHYLQPLEAQFSRGAGGALELADGVPQVWLHTFLQ
jgi:hypothetical protein